MAPRNGVRWLLILLRTSSAQEARKLVFADMRELFARISLRAFLKRGLSSYTLWYRRLQTDKNPLYAVSNLKRLQESYEDFGPEEKEEASEAITKIVNHLVLPNGTVMVSRRGRHREAIRIFLDRFSSKLPSPLRVLELGCSLGIDGLDIFEMLSSETRLARYRLTDLHRRLLLDEENQLAYDEEGNLVQAFLRGRAISIHVSGYFRWTRWLMWLLNVSYAMQARRLEARAGSVATTPVSLLHPEVLPLVRAGKMEFMRQDMLKPIEPEHDLVIAFNLLVPCYFRKSELRAALRNICESLPEGGFLIVGEESNDFAVFSKTGNTLVARYRHGMGSACDHLLDA